MSSFLFNLIWKFIYLQRKKRRKSRGSLSIAFWVQKALDFRWLESIRALITFMFERGGIEGFVVGGDEKCRLKGE